MQIPIKYRLYQNRLWVRWGQDEIWKVARVTKTKIFRAVTQKFGNNFQVTKKHPPGREDWEGKWFYGEVIKGIKGHSGMDWTAPIGTRLYAPEDMEIIQLATYDGLGIKAKSKIGQHTFWHLSEFACAVGDKIKKGEFFALSGNTGKYSTAPHLHWSFKPLNPDRENGYKGSIDFIGFLEDSIDVRKFPYKDGQAFLIKPLGKFYVYENGELVFKDSEKNPATRHIDIVDYFIRQNKKGLPKNFIEVMEDKDFNKFRYLIR